MNLKQATRNQARIKMALQGPSGSGKTYSSLLLAYGLVGDWTKIAVIDSEHNSAHLYAHLGPYNVLGISQPFPPEKYIEALETCLNAGMKAIIVDSISHEWDGIGGILNIHGNMAGNSFTNWNKVTPRHNAFVQTMLQSDAHIIATIRSKQDYVLTDKNGKMVPEKVGMKGVQRDGMDYEFTLVYELDIRHNAISTKDRTGLFSDKPPFVITQETGQTISTWCKHGKVEKETVVEAINDCQNMDDLRALYEDYPEMQEPLKSEFIVRKGQLNGTEVNPL
jgi:hypothetical protein